MLRLVFYPWGSAGAGAGQKERGAVVWSEGIQREDMLPSQIQCLSRGDQKGRLWRLAAPPAHCVCCVADHLLEVIEDEKRGTQLADGFADGFEDGLVIFPMGYQVQRLCRGVGDARERAGLGEVDKKGVRGLGSGVLLGQPRLAHAPRAPEGDQPATLPHEFTQSAELHRAPDEPVHGCAVQHTLHATSVGRPLCQGKRTWLTGAPQP